MLEEQRNCLQLEENKVKEIVSAVATVTACAVCCVLGDEEVDEQIQLRDDVIFQLKQQMATQQQKIIDLEHRNKELEDQLSQALIKEEGTCTSVYST